MTINRLEPLVDLYKALAHPTRLRILALLRDGELCVCQINAVIGLAGSTLSEHLAELRRAGLLAERKDGRWVYYALGLDAGIQELAGALWTRLDDVPQVREDMQTSRRLRETSTDLLCTRPSPRVSAARAARTAGGRP